MILFRRFSFSTAAERIRWSGWRFSLALGLLCGAPGSYGQSVAVPPSPRPAMGATLRSAGSAKNVILGAAAAPSHLVEAAYASTLGSEFSQLEPENQMKFGPIHPRPGTALSAYDFAPADEL